ncbi:MAG TPA: 50S ribosomal protein L10 [Candidatus Diapherotrites archaeon]|uniref:Large ribosomal subunit protein uL10 n=1 Tax=Candidatus Iainarchaeum sp. TaxID=3101447 RepID=A0A7J4IX31_9ARCH|nr:50S ribosomal protein L10 [Candidatus Diapherotrites archaeon]
MTSHNRKWKEQQLESVKQLIGKYPIIAVADIRMFPAALFQQIRKKLHGKAVVKVSKTKVVRKALAETGNTAAIADFAQANCAVIFTGMNPFELFAFIKKNKGKVPAKVGAIAEEDISVPAGDTGLPPGPALSDLKAAGLKVAVQGASIAILEDKVVTKAGEAVSPAVAGTLSKLNILPFKVGMKVVAVLEGKDIFKADVLDIDTEKVFSDFMSAHRGAFNLAFNAAIANPATIEMLLAKTYRDAKATALEADILNSVTAGDLLVRAQRQAKEISSHVKDVIVPQEGA